MSVPQRHSSHARRVVVPGLVLSLVQWLDFRRLLEREPVDVSRLLALAASARAEVPLGAALLAAEAVVKGRLIGKLAVQGSLEIHSTANIKGALTAGRLIIPAGHHFRWEQPIPVGTAEIGGELAASVQAKGTVVLRSTGRLFGAIEAGGLVVEAGAIFVGTARVVPRPRTNPGQVSATAPAGAR